MEIFKFICIGLVGFTSGISIRSGMHYKDKLAYYAAIIGLVAFFGYIFTVTS